MTYVFLDFDGVLFNTLKEAYILCRYAFNGTDYLAPVEKSEYQKLYRYKFLVYNSWQYYYLMNLIKEDLSDNELLEKYDYYMKHRDLNAEKKFDEKYYYARKDLMQNHYDFWDKLETPFDFLNGIKNLYDCNKITPIIVSKKNKTAIEYRLKQYGLNIDNSDIFGKDELIKYDTKADFINNYMNKKNILSSFFVDDNSNNLIPCKKYPNITPLLAGWGNIAINETGLSSEEIVNTISKI